MKVMLTVLVLCVSLLSSIAVAAQQQPPKPIPCTQPESHQLDFWVGSWDLTWPAAAGQPAGKGTNTITKGFDGCVIQENFDGGSSLPLRGMSVSMYSPRTRQWQQTWVDNQGGYIALTGEFKDGQMLLYSEKVNPKGQKIINRMSYKNITPDTFDWSWDSSSDGGKTWQVGWPIHYQRRK